MTPNLRRAARALSSVAVLSSLLLAGCRPQDPAPVEPGSQDPLWADVIVAHTHGLVSKRSRIRVAFADDVIAEARLGRDASATLVVEPAVEGQASFTGRREIVFEPATDLESGRRYRVTVTTDGLTGLPATLSRYAFDFQVIEQRFEVEVHGMTTLATAGTLALGGVLRTADVEDEEVIERVLTARYLGEPQAVEWRHDRNGTHHGFSVPGLTRQASASTLEIAWDGAPLGLEERGRREIDVPPTGAFDVTRAQTTREIPPTIQVYFSDDLDRRQNLRGLVRLGDDEPRTRVDGNILTVYPDPNSEGALSLTLQPGIQSAAGGRLAERFEQVVSIETLRPQVRFAGAGIILPDNPVLSVPFEAVGVRSVRVTAFQIFENNVGRFLQDNPLDGARQLGRVGRPLWRRTIPLASPDLDRWNRYSLDTTELFDAHPDGLIRLTLQITRRDSAMRCPGASTPPDETPLSGEDELIEVDESNWLYYENAYAPTSDGSTWNDRGDPCKDAYYQYAEGVRDGRNLLASNIGLLTKSEPGGDLLVVATDLRTSAPLASAKLSVRDFQNQTLATATSDREGFARIALSGRPFYLLAESGDDRGYLKLSRGSSLPVSHLDVGGANVSSGVKGFLYGERGVWRPGDAIHLTLVVEDRLGTLPKDHPVTMELVNPRGQLTMKRTLTAPVGRFYAFELVTSEDAPTGTWTARARLGGNQFTMPVKIETVMPNRLRVELDVGTERIDLGAGPVSGTLFGQWLSGASASGLDADVQLRLRPVPTRFDRFTEFTFDDPTRELVFEPEMLFEGAIGADGTASFEAAVDLPSKAPGMLRASFDSRVFEPGGAFSIGRQSVPLSPFDRYVGIKLPKGDRARGMLLTDVEHVVELASLDGSGEPVSIGDIRWTLHKIDWRWWWDKSGESLAQYSTATHVGLVAEGAAATTDGVGQLSFRIDQPNWGRYLIRACDTDGSHCTGRVFYIDWPGWAGRGQEESGPGASALTLTADKESYTVGDVARVQLPEATEGRALVTIESGSEILDAQWVVFDPDAEPAEVSVPIEASLAPNVYVSVSLIQPHAGKANDRPIRLYGAIPLMVSDPETHLSPVITTDSEWEPESNPSIRVTEAEGRAMTYSVAVVDEGLLGLTSFRTPDPHGFFFEREALGVTTWDLFDDVVGAYGGELERLLALGGGASADVEPEKEKKRFPPVVRFLGPFELAAGNEGRHIVSLPQYIGAVRVMVIAGAERAYGHAESSVPVRSPLMILPTLPRVVGPEETITVPVSTFVMDDAIRDVALSLSPDDHFELQGSDNVRLSFDEPSEKLGMFEIVAGSTLGMSTIDTTATGGGHVATASVNLEVRSPNPRTVRATRTTIEPGESWETEIQPHGIDGSNRTTLEISAVPPVELDRRLDFLIRYPHGCVEQTTSAMFPQLFLTSLTKLDDARRETIERNLASGIDRLRRFQTPAGGFSYWPGHRWQDRLRNHWATSYVGHFLVEADALGHRVPSSMMADWLNHQKTVAHRWAGGSGHAAVDQAYRLYTLALANVPEMGAMNRLRESERLPPLARWQLAAAYHLSGLPDAARQLTAGLQLAVDHDGALDPTFGSRVRDRAIVLLSLSALDRRDEGAELVDYLSSQLASDRALDTHALSFSLMALARFASRAELGAPELELTVGTGTPRRMTLEAPIETMPVAVPDSGTSFEMRNASQRTLYASVTVSGIPAPGRETASASDLALSLSYRDRDGRVVDIDRLAQGSDFIAELRVTNRSNRDLSELALSQIVPSGWEILGTSATSEDAGLAGASDVEFEDVRDDRVYRYFDLESGETKTFVTLLNASYLGRFYLPSTSVEAMYDASTHARSAGQWVVVEPAR